VISDRSGPTGFTTTFNYDSQGNKLTETNALNETTYYTYGDKGRLLTETDALGRTTQNVYDSNGNLIKTIDADKHSSNYSYASNGLLTSVKDANDKTTNFSYDLRGNVLQVKDALGFITDYTYNGRGDKLSETRYRKKADGTMESLPTRWTYDSEGRMTTMTNALNQTTTYEYDKQGRQIAMTDYLGRRTESVYNEKGELITTIAPDNTPSNPNDNPRMQTRYDEAGRKVAEIDQLGRETRYVYDKVGRLLATILPDSTPTDWTDNARTQTEYYTDGLVKAQIDELGHRTEFRYDALGRQIAVIAADTTPNDLSDNPTTKYVYDKAGQQTAMTDALGHTTRYEYDQLGRMVKTIFADKTFMTQEYDDLGRRVAAVDQNGKRTAYRYDDLGRLTGVQDALLGWTSYGYNEQGQLVSMTDAELHTTRYEYDQLGRRSATILPLNQRSSMTYDAVGNLKTTTDFNGKTIAFNYDEQNRLTEKVFQDGSKVVYTYTLNGQRDTIAVKNASGLTTEFYDWNYDVRDRLTQRIDLIDGVQRSISYTYDAASNRTSVTTGSGTINYTFDERNRLDLVKQNGQVLADYDYDAVSNLTRTKLANGTEEVRQYDTLNRLKYLENHLGTTVISSFAYTLDKVGNRTQVLENTGRKVNYTYDDLYRLTQEAIDEVGTANDRMLAYNYDKVGNRLSKKETSGTTITQTDYQYDGNDRLLGEKVNGTTTTTYTYDNNGSTLTKTENGVTTAYTWNDEKRLIGATITNAQNVVQQQLQYRYNDDGIRVASVVNGQETRYLLDEVQAYPQVLEEYAPNGTVQVSYVYGNDLISQTQLGQTTYYHVDGLGSTTELTDTTGTIVSSSRYDAFGNSIAQTGSVSNKYLFTGEQFDSNLGDYYLRQRFYDPSSGRFTKQDSYGGRLQEPLTLHKYLYADSNPVGGIDPTGLFSMNDVTLTLLLVTIAVVTTATAYNSLSGGGSPARTISQLNTKQRTAMTNSAYAPYLKDLKQDTEENKSCYFAEVPRRGFRTRTEDFEETGEAYANYVTGSKFDYFVLSRTGVPHTFDGRSPGTNQVWETKWGNEFINSITSPGKEKLAQSIINRWNIAERLPGLEVAIECGYLFTWAISNRYLFQTAKNQWGGIPPTVHIPFAGSQ
jgi:RHS repeat-associated protein